jgi:hypothetical protein
VFKRVAAASVFQTGCLSPRSKQVDFHSPRQTGWFLTPENRFGPRASKSVQTPVLYMVGRGLAVGGRGLLEMKLGPGMLRVGAGLVPIGPSDPEDVEAQISLIYTHWFRLSL